MGVLPGKSIPTKTEPNRNKESDLDLIIPNILNECYS